MKKINFFIFFLKEEVNQSSVENESQKKDSLEPKKPKKLLIKIKGEILLSKEVLDNNNNNSLQNNNTK